MSQVADGQGGGRDAAAGGGSSGPEYIRWREDDDGVVTLTLDLPGSANVMNATYRAAMGAIVARLEASRADGSLSGIVITSAKKSFFAGADLNELIRVTPALLDEFVSVATDVKDQMRRLERLGVPVAAAVNGSALGGGLELALACHHRVCWDDPSVRIGLPETTLGLLPGGAG